MQHPTIDRQPTPVKGLNLVGDGDMGVQIRVAGATVAVRECGRDQTGDIDLPHTLRPLPGE